MSLAGVSAIKVEMILEKLSYLFIVISDFLACN